jgi:hypothetical protein
MIGVPPKSQQDAERAPSFRATKKGRVSDAAFSSVDGDQAA